MRSRRGIRNRKGRGEGGDRGQWRQGEVGGRERREVKEGGRRGQVGGSGCGCKIPRTSWGTASP